MIMKYKKGQITLVNLFAFFLTIFVWSVIAPIMDSATVPVVEYFEANPTPISPFVIVLIQMLSFVVLLSIILSIINQAIPQREGYRV